MGYQEKKSKNNCNGQIVLIPESPETIKSGDKNPLKQWQVNWTICFQKQKLPKGVPGLWIITGESSIHSNVSMGNQKIYK